MDATAWLRFTGLVACLALGPDVYYTSQLIEATTKRRQIQFILVALPFLDVLELLLVPNAIFLAVCPVYLKLLAASLYGTRVLMGYTYIFRLEIALATSNRSKLVINCLKFYLLLTFLLNVGKALVIYESYVEDGACVISFGDGLWLYLDEIMFSALDVLTCCMLFFFYLKPSNFVTREARHAVSRIVIISVIPVCSTACTLVEMAESRTDASKIRFLAALDYQVHCLCIYIIYASARHEMNTNVDIWKKTYIKTSKNLRSCSMSAARQIANTAILNSYTQSNAYVASECNQQITTALCIPESISSQSEKPRPSLDKVLS